ncbi:PREDICTED: plant UBX domain-containing protein 8 [Prunus mume]|uniref:Plant UBX domain-containing protein 8 n=1 Tax=Prunus mume TaxID=102107 RepID=A0ABM1LUH9_PRUMU|nr:PREDICTED: plant UBX domain-containing protein 8 [Prunus mume]
MNKVCTSVGLVDISATSWSRNYSREHGGDLNEAVNAHFTEGDRNTSVNVHETPVAAQDDLMDIDDPVPVGPRRDPLSLLSATRDINPFSLLNPSFGSSIFESGSDFRERAPFVTHPREVREIPIEVKDDGNPSSHSGHAPTIDDVTGTAHAYGPGIPGTVIIDDEDDDGIPGTVIIDDEDDDVPAAPTVQAGQGSGPQDISSGDGSHHRNFGPSAPRFDDPQDYSNDIEEEMIRAAIEASKREVEESQQNQLFAAPTQFDDNEPQQRPPHLEDPELAHAVSLSLKTAEQEKALRGQGENVGPSEMGASKAAEVELGKLTAPNGRLEGGSSSIQDETEDVEEQPLVRHRSRRMSSGSVESAKDVGATEDSAPSSPGEQDMGNHPRHSGSVFPTDEWGGISSEEHDEAVMLEAAMFGGIPEGSGYRLPYAPHQFMRTESSYPRPAPRPPSPSLTAQRLIREQQDDEYLASLQADREKELKAIEEAEARRQEDRLKEEESQRKFEEEQVL